MFREAIYAMVYLGAALMVYNIYGFVRYARYVKNEEVFRQKSGILHLPIALLVMFLLGYLGIGLFGKPDLLIGGVLFGGSIFVFIMYKLLSGITRRVIENEQLRAELMAAEHANLAKTSFLATMSHEMRTPLNVILGLDSLAMKNPDLQPETREQLEKIDVSARHLLGLINDMLDMNHIETGTVEPKNEVFRLSDTLLQVNAIYQTMCEEKGLSYEAELQEGADDRYVGDEALLKKALVSILDNAVKYTDAPGTVRLKAEEVFADENVRTLKFTVADSGIGIGSEFLPKIFDKFTQEDDSSTSRFSGSGLSLAITKNLIELLGGSISVESEKNAGSTFTVILPLRIAPPEELPAEEPEEPVSLEGRRVLIVEDLPENAEIVQDLLELEGVESEHAENGQIGLEMFEQAAPHYYDAILMDLRMPVMDGLEATRRIRALERADAKIVPIIALTANAFENDIRQSLEAGMDAHLAKPADSDLLYRTLAKHIRLAADAERRNAT